MPNARPAVVHAAWTATIAILLAGISVRVHADQSANAAQHTWSSETSAALAAYRAADYAEAQRLCRQLQRSQGEDQRLEDAAVIEALCLLRQPARVDREEALTRLKQLTEADPTLRDDPECNLAAGIALTALAETGAALDALDRAAAGFAAAGPPERRAEPLIALAEAWAGHAEWEQTPVRFGVARPQSSPAARAIRHAQIAALRQRIEALPDHAEALERYDLVLAQFLIDSDEGPADGVQLLQRLASAPTLSATRAAAAVRLAEYYAAAGQGAAAVPLYERVVREWRGELQTRAEEQLSRATRPQLDLDLPATVPPGQTVRVQLRARGFETGQFEVRKVDVEAWLGSPRTRQSEALLPEAGAVVTARELSLRATDRLAWWDAQSADPPLEFTAPPGAYVVLVKATASDGRPQTVKRLVLVSDLAAACFVGTQHVLVWATSAPHAPLTARFWMHSSFAPVTAEMHDGLARFPLPNEARLTPDQSWVCLVQSGEHLAVCRGSLPVPAARGLPRVALLAGPPTPGAGEPLHVCGVLLPSAGGTLDVPDGATVEIEITDAVERFRRTVTVPLNADGAFSQSWIVPAEVAGQHLRLVAHYRGQTLPQIGPRATASVLPVDAALFHVRFDLPKWLAPGQARPAGQLVAEYPWGTVPTGVQANLTIETLRLPTDAGPDEPVSVAMTYDDEQRLDARGRLWFELPLADLEARSGPAVVRVSAELMNREGRRGAAEARVLIAAQRPHLWLRTVPARPTRGTEVRFHAGWYDPEGLMFARPPVIVVRKDDAEIAELGTQTDEGGFLSAPWVAEEPGLYDASLAVPGPAGKAVKVRREFEIVDVAPSVESIPAALRGTARQLRENGRVAVRVELEARTDTRLLVLVAGNDPLGAQVVTPRQGHATLTIPLAAEPTAGARVSVARLSPAGLERLCEVPLAPDPQRAATLRLVCAAGDIWPETTVVVRATPRFPGGAPRGTTLTARLVNAVQAAHFTPSTTTRRDDSPAAIFGLAATASTGAATARPGESCSIADSPDDPFERALCEGATLWCTSMSVSSSALDLPVPLPPGPGLYKLIGILRTPDGAIATDTVILDARRGVRIALDVPPRLATGDRALAAVRLENGSADEVEVQVRCTLDAGLSADTWRVVGASPRSASFQTGELVTVTLTGGGQAWLRSEIEALHEGPAQLTVEVAARGAARRAVANCNIESTVSPPAGGLVVRRKLWAWTQLRDDDTDAADESLGPRFGWLDVVPGTAVSAGQIIKVQEEFTLPESQPEILWAQRLPATCRVAMTAPETLTTLGRRQTDRSDALVYSIPPLEMGPQKHTYALAVVRPGACVLPAPELRSGEHVIPIRTEPEDLRIIVLDGR